MQHDPDTGLRELTDLRPFPVGPSTFEEMWTRRDPASVALVRDDREWTTSELHAETERVARCLVDAGLTPGDRVAWVVHDELDSLVSLLATVRTGGVWIGLSGRATEAERRPALDATQPRLTLTSLPTDDPDVELPEAPAPDALAAIALTSGTTGRPKLVAHIQQQLLYPAAAAIETEALDTTSRVGTPLPVSTLNLLLLGPVTALACGGTAVSMRRPDAAGFTADVEHHRVTRALVVPTIVHDLVTSDIDPRRLASLERLVMGGAGLDRDRARAAQEHLGVPLFASYGLSEAPTGVARMRVGDAGATPLPGIDIRVEPDREITLAPATKGPWAGTWQGALGYLAGEGHAPVLWRDGRLHTGDAGSLDEEGRLLVTGRVSDMINRGGATIAPAEVERVLLAVPDVEDVAVFGVDDDRLGQAVAAAVVGLVDTDGLTREARAELSGYKVPERWLIVEQIPRNANGKVDRDELRRLIG